MGTFSPSVHILQLQAVTCQEDRVITSDLWVAPKRQNISIYQILHNYIYNCSIYIYRCVMRNSWQGGSYMHHIRSIITLVFYWFFHGFFHAEPTSFRGRDVRAKSGRSFGQRLRIQLIWWMIVDVWGNFCRKRCQKLIWMMRNQM